MKVKPYVDKLYASSEYKSFQKQHSNAYITAGFFVLDLEAGKHIHQIDFYVPREKKIAAFTLDHGVKMQMMSLMHSSKTPEELDMQVKIDLEALKGILDDEMKNRNITENIKKIIAVLQNIDGKKIWNINCVLSGMGILRAHVDDESKSVLKMEKASIMDYVRRMSPADLQKMSQQVPSQVPAQSADGEISGEVDGEKIEPDESGKEPRDKPDNGAKLKQLEALEKAIAQEKAIVMKEEKRSSKQTTKESFSKLKKKR